MKEKEVGSVSDKGLGVGMDSLSGSRWVKIVFLEIGYLGQVEGER